MAVKKALLEYSFIYGKNEYNLTWPSYIYGEVKVLQ